MNALELSRALKCPMARAVKWVHPLNRAMQRFDINTPARQAAFLAQIGHESGRLQFVRELASGKDYDTGRKAIALGNTPEADGDGQRYKGRGLIQITGFRNYVLCGTALELDLIDHPELLEQPEHAAMSAAWFWWNARLNELADKGDFRTITRRINGGFNGLADRLALYESSRQALGVV
jgi:putative chitinase